MIKSKSPKPLIIVIVLLILGLVVYYYINDKNSNESAETSTVTKPKITFDGSTRSASDQKNVDQPTTDATTANSDSDSTDDPDTAVSSNPSAAGGVNTPEATDQELVRYTLSRFYYAAETDNFTSFFDDLATSFAQHTDPADLSETFKAYIDNPDLLKPILDGQLAIGTSTKENAGHRSYSGQFITDNRVVAFDLNYALVEDHWLLTRIIVDSKRP
ncbi:TPA: hypothetical protein DF272_02825 [Candidatus Falkowbacteria bacterium]|nr:hypothetical protein [Candidatus Falkowbacteria bacterium]